MQTTKDDLLQKLEDLRENHHVLSVKTEFETEGSSYEEAFVLKELSEKINLEYTVKIGGCGAVRDIIDAQNLKAHNIVAPMIETPYSLEKFVLSFSSVYKESDLLNTRFLINIETITGINNLPKIAVSPFFEKIDGIVLGRKDLINSLNLSSDEINSSLILEYAMQIADVVATKNKKLIIGGELCSNSLDFLRKLGAKCALQFETRKIIFDSQAINDINISIGLRKSIEFEIMWLLYLQKVFGEDSYKNNRIKSLESRLSNSQIIC